MKIIIIGGGPVGLAAALAIHRSRADAEITVLEAAPRERLPWSDRNLALSQASWQRLQRWGIDPASLPRAPIERIEVSQAGRFGLCVLEARELGLPMLGAAVPYPMLVSALRAKVDALQQAGDRLCMLYSTQAASVAPEGAKAVVRLAEGERLLADLVVLAEGAGMGASALYPAFRSFARDSGQVAILTRLQAERGKQAGLTRLAIERFTAGGALALVPRVVGTGEEPEWTLIWARPKAEAARLLALEPQTFTAEVNAQAGSTLGTLRLAEAATRSEYPLTWRFTEPRALDRVVAIGNAAQALHPVAAQGLNLGLADVQSLADTLRLQGSTAVDVPMLVGRYARMRAPDRVFRIGFSGALAYGFERAGGLLDGPRGAALMALQLLPGLKRTLLARLALQ